MGNAIENITKKYGMEGVNCPQCGVPFFYPTGALLPVRGLEPMEDKGDGWMYLARTGSIKEHTAEFRCTNCRFITDISPPVNVLKEQALCTDFALADK